MVSAARDRPTRTIAAEVGPVSSKLNVTGIVALRRGAPTQTWDRHERRG
jgi:hypothetical protein